MDTTELAANLFRMTQTKERLKNERIRNQQDAIKTHEMVGRKVRSTIEDLGGTLPENITPAEPIKNVKKRVKAAQPRLILDSKDLLDETRSS